jgi:alpha-glucosidase
MYLVSPRQVSRIEGAAHPLEFAGQDGERLRISVLADDLIRVQLWPDGQPRLDRTWMVVGADGDVPREGRRRDDLSPFPLPAFDLDAADGVLRLRTADLHVTIRLNDFRLVWSDAAERPFAADLIAQAYQYDRRGRAVYHYLVRDPDEHYYGFGEKAGPLDKAAARLRMHNVDALGYNAETSDPLYKHFPFYITYVPALDIAYGLFYDNLADSVFDLGREVNARYGGPFRAYRADDGDLDYTLIYGPSIEAVIEKFTTLTGRPVLPPRWTLGYLGSTMSYTEAPNAQEQLRQFVDLCRQHDIPCDLFHLSSGYTTGPDGKRYVFTWNHSRVPDPGAMAQYFHDAGIRLAANIKPYLLTTHPYYDDLAAQGGLVRQADRDEPEIAPFWSGGRYEFDYGSYVDLSSAAGYDWWQAHVTAALFEHGIDVTWNDNNEFEIVDDAARLAGFGEPIPAALGRPLLTLLMLHASYAATVAHRPDERPFLLTRAGLPGIQRYAQTWSGDNTTSWNTLRYNIPMGLSLSLSGVPNTGHDVGGFHGPRPDAELFVRWVQNGIFHPRFTIHSWNTDGTVNEPWMYPDVLPLVREAIRFRYRLLPYLYTLLFESAETGHPIIRPLVYHFAHDARCRTESFDFMLGPNLLVASVLEPGARTRQVYLPSGTAWCDFWSGEWHAGGQAIEVAAPLERYPLFVPAGGLIPTGKVMQHVGAQPDDVRRVYAFPDPAGSEGRFMLIEDDGTSLEYRRGAVARVTLSMQAGPDRIALAAQADQSGYPLPYTQIEFVLPPDEVRPTGGGTEHTGTDGRRVVVVPLR